jgi:hypothetical protein
VNDVLPCRCQNTTHELNVNCFNRVNHGRLEGYPYYRSTMRQSVEEYHDWVLANGILGEKVVRESFTSVGVPVQHSVTYKHQWKDPYRGPGSPDYPRDDYPVPEPLVRCRDAYVSEVCDEAARAARAARAAGFTVRVTYAQGGTWRKGTARGTCGVCKITRRVIQETGLLSKHNVSTSVACDGTGLVGDLCISCGKKAKVLKKGGLGKHYVTTLTPCLGTDEMPVKTFPAAKVEPVKSIVVRVKNHAVGCWVEGAFTEAYVVKNRRWTKVGSVEFKRACAG